MGNDTQVGGLVRIVHRANFSMTLFLLVFFKLIYWRLEVRKVIFKMFERDS